MADGQLSRPLSPHLHADPRHARRPRLRFAVGNADEGHRTDGLDDRTPLRDRLREARAQQAALEIDHRSFRAAETQRAAAQPVLSLWAGNRLAVESGERPAASGSSWLRLGLRLRTIRA